MPAERRALRVTDVRKTKNDVRDTFKTDSDTVLCAPTILAPSTSRYEIRGRVPGYYRGLVDAVRLEKRLGVSDK